MTSDDLDTWRVIYGVFLGAELESDIHFVLNNHPDAQTRFHSVCQIDQREGTVSFAAIRSVLRELFVKNHGGSVRPPTSARVNLLLATRAYEQIYNCHVPCRYTYTCPQFISGQELQ